MGALTVWLVWCIDKHETRWFRKKRFLPALVTLGCASIAGPAASWPLVHGGCPPWPWASWDWLQNSCDPEWRMCCEWKRLRSHFSVLGSSGMRHQSSCSDASRVSRSLGLALASARLTAQQMMWFHSEVWESVGNTLWCESDDPPSYNHSGVAEALLARTELNNKWGIQRWKRYLRNPNLLVIVWLSGLLSRSRDVWRVLIEAITTPPAPLRPSPSTHTAMLDGTLAPPPQLVFLAVLTLLMSTSKMPPPPFFFSHPPLPTHQHRLALEICQCFLRGEACGRGR